MDSGRRTFIRQSSLAGFALLHSGSLNIFTNTNGLSFESPYFKLQAAGDYPVLNYFAADSLGERDFLTNCLLSKQQVVQGLSFTSVKEEQRISYRGRDQRQAQWEISCEAKKITLTSRAASDAAYQIPFTIMMAQKANYSTVLGALEADGQMNLPCILHLPGMGSVKISCQTPGTRIRYDALNDAGRSAADPHVSVAFPPTVTQEPLVFELEPVSICPPLAALQTDRRLKGLRRDLINIFQLNPRRNILANNSGSDNCVFTVYLYAEAARRCPDLFEGFPAMTLVRDSLNRYLSGYDGYGFVGHPGWISKHDSLDSYPSLIISASYYILQSNDREWAGKHFVSLKKWADHMMSLDKNGDGLIEYGYSGNAGSWRAEFRRPANWWDAIGFGHDDAYSNALAYRALVLLSRVAANAGYRHDMKRYRLLAARLKAAYFKAFYNPASGLLAGWRSADGKLHDYAFTFVNSIAVCYGLLNRKQAAMVMDALLKKMQEVGYTNFKLGLPGNLVPVRSEDYTHADRRWGYGEKEDGSDGFQIYENGGASGCFAFFTIKALVKAGRRQAAEHMLLDMMDAFTNREFQGQCRGSAMSKDWKTWKGECWGYEGFLVDNYLTLFAAVDIYGKPVD